MKKVMLGLMLLLAAGAAWGQRDEVPALDWFDPATAINQGSLTEAGEVISKKLTVNGHAALDTLSVAEGPATSSVVNIGGSLSLAEQAAGDADTAGYGQVWVKDTVPAELWFTDDAGADFVISGAGGTVTGSGSANTVPLWTSGSVLGDSTISQTGGFLDVGDELKLDDGDVGQPSLVFDGNTDAGWFYGSGKIQLGVDGTAISTWDASSIDIGHTSTLITLHNDVLIKDDFFATPSQRALRLINTDEGVTSAVAIEFGLTNSVNHIGSYSGSISSAKTGGWTHLPPSQNADMNFYTALFGGGNQVLKLTSGGDTWTYGSLGAGVDPATTAGIITAEGSLFLRQQAAADANTVEYGQLWVEDFGEGKLWFTDDEGADYLLNINYAGASNSLLTLLGTVSLRERAAADAATAGYGQLWVKDSSPAELMFRDDAGTDFLIGGGGAGTLTGGGSTSAIAMFTSSSSLGDSSMYDVSGEIGLNTSTPTSLFDARDAGGAVATLSTSETVVVDGTKLGQLDFSAPQEASGGDALLPAASIWAEADAIFSAGVNTADLVFGTGQSEAAVEKARLTSDGKWDVTGIIEAGSGDTVITTAAGDVIVGSGGSVDDGALSANVAHLNVAETVSADWVNTANPWADDEVVDALTISGGTVDSSAIGATTAASGAFTTLSSSGLATLNSATVAGKLGVGGATATNSQVNVEGSISLAEQPAADVDTAAYGQLWIKDTVPNELWYTDDAGTDVQLGVGGSTDWPNPGTIGSATPNTGAYTTLSASANLDVAGTIEAGSGNTTLTTAAGLLRHQAIDSAIAGSGLTATTGVLSVDSHAPEAHSIASHSDTMGTGAELNTLTDDSMADALHRHSELSASDGIPDPALSVDAAGLVGIGGDLSVDGGDLTVGSAYNGNIGTANDTDQIAFTSGKTTMNTDVEVTNGKLKIGNFIAAFGNRDDLVISKDQTQVGISIISETDGTTGIFFGDEANFVSAGVTYGAGIGNMLFNVNGNQLVMQLLPSLSVRVEHNLNVLEGAVINEVGGDNDFRVEGVGETNALFVRGSDGFVSVGLNTPTGKFHVDQASTSAAIPTVVFDQADISEGVINFIASDRGVVATSVANSIASVRVEINGVVYVIALHADR